MKIKTSELIGAVDLTDTVCKALRRSWHLGQTYWQQADSESFAQNKKAETTHAAFVALLDDTRAALAAAPAQPVAQQGMAYAALPEWAKNLGGLTPTEIRHELHAFADATCALRASHWQAPAQPAPAAEWQEPVAVVVTCHTPSGKRVALYSAKQDLPIGTQLYTAHLPSPAVQGDAMDAARWHWLSEHIQVAWNEGKFTSLVRIVSEQHRQSLNASVDRMMAGDWSDADAARAAQEGKKP